MIAVLAAVLATVIGTTAALAMNKLNFKGKSIFMSIMIAPMVVPVVVVGAALYTTFAPIGLTNSIPGLVLAHTLLGIPMVFVTMLSSFANVNENLELGTKSVKKAVELAVKYNKLVDVHCDETDDDMSRFVEVLAYEAMDNGIGSRTTASHTCAMGSYNNAYAFKLFKLLKKSGVNSISCPTENIHLQGRYDAYPIRRGLTRVKEMLDDNINVCFAQDSICDPWYPLGNGNLMYVLDAGFHICHLTAPEYMNRALDLISCNGARTMNLGDRYFLREGNPASFIVIDADSDFDALRNRAGVLMSVRNGKVLFRKKPTEFAEEMLTDKGI